MKRSKALISIFMCALSANCVAVSMSGQQTKKMLSPEEVKLEVDKKGAREFVLDLGDSSKKWRYIIKKYRQVRINGLNLYRVFPCQDWLDGMKIWSRLLQKQYQTMH